MPALGERFRPLARSDSALPLPISQSRKSRSRKPGVGCGRAQAARWPPLGQCKRQCGTPHQTPARPPPGSAAQMAWNGLGTNGLCLARACPMATPSCRTPGMAPQALDSLPPPGRKRHRLQSKQLEGQPQQTPLLGKSANSQRGSGELPSER